MGATKDTFCSVEHQAAAAASAAVRRVQPHVCWRLKPFTDTEGHVKRKVHQVKMAPSRASNERWNVKKLNTVSCNTLPRVLTSNACVLKVTIFSAQSGPHCLTWSLGNSEIPSEVCDHLHIMCSLITWLIASQPGFCFLQPDELRRAKMKHYKCMNLWQECTGSMRWILAECCSFLNYAHRNDHLNMLGQALLSVVKMSSEFKRYIMHKNILAKLKKRDAEQIP